MTRRYGARTDARSSSRPPSWRRTTAVVLASIVVGAPNVEAASLDLGWTGPTTNADGTPLTDLAGYRVYLGTAVLPPCPGTPFGAVASANAAPTTGETAQYQVPGLSAGVTYSALITAVDSAGNESGCAGPVSGVARADLSVSPAGAVNLGSTPVGTAVDVAFTVQNTTASSMTGAASAGSPFSVLSGGSFSLAPGASQAVIVRLLSTVAGSFASNVNFTANGDTVSRTVTGSATDAISPTAPVPVVSSLSPSSATAGALGFTLTVDGSGFGSSSVVRWNGADRATTFVSAGQLRAAIAASDLAAAGSVPVGVFTPAPGGGTSATPTFTVTAATGGGDIVIDNAAPGTQDPAGGRTFTGTWCLSNATNQFGPNSLRSCGTAADTYRWTPTIVVTGTYDVYVWVPRYNAHSTSVPILVAHTSGTTTRVFNERKAVGNWVLHGRYTFNAGTAGYVQTSAANGTALADAIRFAPIK
jgi:IPT/TIG domain